MNARNLAMMGAGLLASCPSPADTLALGSTDAAAGVTVQLPFSFGNTNEIVAMQLDLKFPPSQVDVADAITTSAAPDHTASSRQVSTGTRRIVVYSSGNHLLPSDVVLQVPVTIKNGVPLGGPTLTIADVILTNKLGQQFTPTINRNALDAWRLANFTESERADPAVIGDDRDPDGDGLGNLFEFLMGGNPKIKNPAHAPRVSHEVSAADNHRYMKMVFRMGKNMTGGTLTVEGSANLGNWNAAGIVLTPTGVEDATSVEYEAAVLSDGVERFFLRIVGIRNPAP